MLLITFITVLPKDAGIFKLAIHLQLHPTAGDAICFVLIADSEVEFEGVWFRNEEGGEVHCGIVGGVDCVCVFGWTGSRLCCVLFESRAEVNVFFGWRRRRLEHAVRTGKIESACEAWKDAGYGLPRNVWRLEDVALQTSDGVVPVVCGVAQYLGNKFLTRRSVRSCSSPVLLTNLVLVHACGAVIVGDRFLFSISCVSMHGEHPGHAAKADKKVGFGHAHALASATSIAKLTVACNCGEFGQWLLVGWVFVLQPSHWIPYIRLVKDFGIARDGPLERMHYRPCRDMVTVVDVVLD
jgi:hypothetical protein